VSRQWNSIDAGIPPMNIPAVLRYEYDSGIDGYTIKHNDETFSEASGNLPITHWLVIDPPVLGEHR